MRFLHGSEARRFAEPTGITAVATAPSAVETCWHVSAIDDVPPWADPVFSVASRTYTWADVVAFSRGRSKWEELMREVAEGLACQRAGLRPSAGAVERAAKEFRYQRRLLTAEETEGWLQRRAIDTREWFDHMQRTVLRAEHESRLPTLIGTATAWEDPDDKRVWVTGRCGPLLDALAIELAERVAAHERLVVRRPLDVRDLDDDVLDRLRIEVVTVHGLDAIVTQRRLDWLRVEIEIGQFRDKGAAQEAVMSVRDEGLGLAEVCLLAGVEIDRRTTRLEQLEAPLHPAVLGAHEGAIVGPVEVAGHFLVAEVRSKTVPDTEDPEIVDLAAEAILRTVIRGEVEQRVTWHDFD